MNDMLHLHFAPGDYQINTQKFIHDPNEEFNPLDGTLVGFPIYKRKHEHNDGLMDIRTSYKGLKVQVNPNKALKKEIGSSPLTFQELQNCIEKLNDYISDENLGNFNLSNSRIVRFDHSFDIKTSLTFDKYFPIIGTLAPRSQRIKQSKKRMFENTVTTGNSSREISIYDKTKESDLKDDFIRFEFRHLKLKRDYPKFGFNKLTESKYLSIRESDKEMIYNYVFGQEPAILKDSIENTTGSYFLELLEDITLNSTNINKLAISYLLNQLVINEGYPIDKILRVPTSSKVYRRNNDYINLLSKTRLGDSIFIERYNELKELFRRVA